MGKPKKDNVASLKRHKEVIEFGLEYDGEVKHRWVCSCGSKGQWYNRAYRKWYLVTLWMTHLARAHPEFDTDLEDLDNEGEGI